MTFEQVWQEAETIEGYLFKEEGQALFELTEQLPENSVVVELGSFCGKSSKIIAEAVRDRKSKLYCVDSYIPHFDGVPVEPVVALTSFQHHILGPFYDFVELVKKDTSKAARYFKREIDFLFMDADHSEAGVKKDCKAWLPKLKSGAVVAFHDYHDTNWPGVKDASATYVSTWNNVRNNRSLAAFRKP